MKLNNKTFKGKVESLGSNQIFVFGSNTEGRHGLGAAKLAKEKFGAIYGQSHGRQGKSFAIITKDISKNGKKWSKWSILGQVLNLYNYAINHPELEFLVAYLATGKNLNGYTPEEMASIFANAGKVIDMIPDNISFNDEFYLLIKSEL